MIKLAIYNIIMIKLVIYNIIMIKPITFTINTYLCIKIFNSLLGFLYEQNHTMIRSYPGKSMIVFEFEPSRGMTRRNQRRTQNKTKMEDTII